MIYSIALSAATALMAAVATPTTQECMWEAPGRARVTVTYYKRGELYLRYNDVRVEILDRDGVIAASPDSRHGRYWFIFARDSAGELIAEDDYVPPVVSLSPKESKAKTALPTGARQLAAGTVLNERINWDSSLLPGQQWKVDERYSICPANGLWARDRDEALTDVIPISIAKCLILDARVVVGADGAGGN
ncbi:hypothetical protein DFR29_12831 [Tahibacter aquaticus]|uniref:Uncharacterized protein n=1 Tax=Tahibacter aquaticus TaxID=520092 RepID=A0A4V3DKY5_9GAMM|nr:hypothetical protein [Tahibacter aquaticus]TDR36610.1 hypothetical protein DFR29_12831 [Tahibacter aquaticus]